VKRKTIMPQHSDSAYRLQIGPVIIEFRLESPEIADEFTRYFGLRSAPGDPDLVLEMTVSGHSDIPRIPNSLLAGKIVEGHEFNISDGLITGSYEPGGGSGTVVVKSIVTKGQYMRVFEQLIYQAVQSAMQARKMDAIMVHSCSVILDDRGVLFVGASGTGKSTVASLGKTGTVLNDEMSFVEFHDGGATLHSTPFNGFFKEKATGKAPLEAIFLLAHGPRHRIVPVGAAEAVMVLGAQVCPPVRLQDPLTPGIKLRMLDLAEKLQRAAPVSRLEFTPDAGLWPIVQEHLFKENP
jgi:hypothetical protein